MSIGSCRTGRRHPASRPFLGIFDNAGTVDIASLLGSVGASGRADEVQAYLAASEAARNGWWGNSAVALCYEGLPWFAGAAVMAAALPDWRIVLLATLYSTGAHGIMTLNDFKSVEGDRGIGSPPVRLGPDGAARFACLVMPGPQAAVAVCLLTWDRPWHAGLVCLMLLVQFVPMRRLLGDPHALAPRYSATGVSLYVQGMLVSAFAVASLPADA